MDYGKILTRAWEITWRWKFLWIFGFLVSLGQGGSRGGNSFNWVEDRGFEGRFPQIDFPPEIAGLLIALACVGVIVGIALWVLSVIGRGALIGGVQQVEEEGTTSLGQAWRTGVSRFWTLFGIGFLTGLPILILALIVVAAFVGPILTDVGVSAGREGPMGIFALSFICGAPLCCLTIVVAIALSQIKIYADRAAVLERLGWIDAVKRGWEVLKENLAPTVVFWLIFFGIGLALLILIGGPVLVVSLPFMGIVANSDPGPWLVVPLVCGGLLVAIIWAVVGSVVETFTSTTWTLAYREMIERSEAPAEELEVESAT